MPRGSKWCTPVFLCAPNVKKFASPLRPPSPNKGEMSIVTGRHCCVRDSIEIGRFLEELCAARLC